MKKINYYILIAFSLLLFSLNSTFAQEASKTLPIEQNTSKFLPHNLGPNINTVEYGEINPIISPDGKTLYFTRINHPENTYGTNDSQDIWFSELRADGTWGKAQRMPNNVNVGKFNSVLSISSDGKTILLTGRYTKKGNWLKRGLSISSKTSLGWSNPEPLKIPRYSKRNKGEASNAYMNNKGDVIVFAYTKSFGTHHLNLYISKLKDGKWTKPKKIKNLSTRFHSEEAPSFSGDGKTLYFSSHYNHGKIGKFDIYKSTRLDDSYLNWGDAQLLSDTINSKDWESYYRVNIKNSYAYFASNHGVEKLPHHLHAQADIFGIKLLEENPFVEISGKVINTKTDKALNPKFNFQILIDGKLTDSITYNRDSSTYKVKLPLGKVYEICAGVKNFTHTSEKIDVSKIREFTKLNQNLKVSPIPYSHISGHVYQQGTINIIPASCNPRLYINDVRVDSVKINKETGAYSINLPNGKSYLFRIEADKHIPNSVDIDLSKNETFSDVKQNLYAEPKKQAYVRISGKIIDKKTNGVINPSIPVKVFVNDKESNANYNPQTGEYALNLPVGPEYTINASADGYYPVYENIPATNSDNDVYLKRDLVLAPIEVGQSVKINNINFETGKSILKKESFEELDRVVNFLNTNKTIKIQIQGHTDNVGKPDKNLQLSKARAKAVIEYLSAQGIDPVRLTSEGFGQNVPVADNKTPAGKALNRRVEFKILGK